MNKQKHFPFRMSVPQVQSRRDQMQRHSQNALHGPSSCAHMFNGRILFYSFLVFISWSGKSTLSVRAAWTLSRRPLATQLEQLSRQTGAVIAGELESTDISLGRGVLESGLCETFLQNSFMEYNSHAGWSTHLHDASPQNHTNIAIISFRRSSHYRKKPLTLALIPRPMVCVFPRSDH